MNAHPCSRLLHITIPLIILVGLLASPSISHPAQATSNTAHSDRQPVITSTLNEQPPTAHAGLDFIVPPGYPARFFGSGATAVPQTLLFSWDFEGDGVQDYTTWKSAMTTYAYTQAGTYIAILTVTDAQGQAAYDSLTVTVDPQAEEQSYVEAVPLRRRTALTAGPADGVAAQYALMLNGSGETRFWDDVNFMYATLIDDYGFTPETIILLNNTGTDPWGGNPNGMIDRPASLESLDSAFSELAERVDGDDHLFLWVTDHGSGYMGNPNDPSYGNLSTFASVDPGDEEDYLERDFKLQALYMDRFFTYYTYYAQSNTYTYARVKHIAYFTDLYFEALGYRTDHDVMLERLYDYLLGDTNKDGSIDPSLGEIADHDGDGIMPYDPATGAFDEDDWGPFDTYDDPVLGVTWISSHIPGDIGYALFDAGFDGKLDIDLSYHGGEPVVEGTDLDGDARFDGVDVNEDGDMDDWVSIDEELSLAGYGLSDDQLAEMVDRVGAGAVSVFMLPCFSGGFIDDLSAPNRVIATATGEEALSYGNLFTDLFAGALHRFSRYGTPIDADADRNGQISMLEAFNYAAGHDYYNEIPLYDDNGDKIGHPYPIPNGGDGDFGAAVYLASRQWTGQIPIDIRPSSQLNKIDRKSKAVVPVAMLSFPGFDAPSQINIASLTFGHSGKEPSLVWKEPSHIPVCITDDTDGDGLMDLVCSFFIPKTRFACGDSQGILLGKTMSGLDFTGTDRVVILSCP